MGTSLVCVCTCAWWDSAQAHQGLGADFGCPALSLSALFLQTCNTSGAGESFLHKGHASLHCIIHMLTYVAIKVTNCFFIGRMCLSTLVKGIFTVSYQSQGFRTFCFTGNLPDLGMSEYLLCITFFLNLIHLQLAYLHLRTMFLFYPIYI